MSRLTTTTASTQGERFLSPARRLGPWLGLAILAVALLVLAPAVLSTFRLGLLAKYLCYAIAAVGIGLAWGRGGMLVLGQGLYFGLGGYAMAMHLKLADAGPGHHHERIDPRWAKLTRLRDESTELHEQSAGDDA